MSRFRKFPGDKPSETENYGSASGKALQLARDLFDLDEDDPGIELVSALVPGAIWRFYLDGEIAIYQEGYADGRHKLCYWFHAEGDQLPGADNVIAAALLATTNEADFARRIIQQTTSPVKVPIDQKIRSLIRLPNN